MINLHEIMRENRLAWEALERADSLRARAISPFDALVQQVYPKPPALAAVEHMCGIHDLTNLQPVLADLGGTGGIAELLRQHLTVGPRLDPFGGLRPISLQAVHELSSPLAAFRASAFYEEAVRGAKIASSMGLPDLLDRHRLDPTAFADRLAVGNLAYGFGVERWRDPAFLSAFNGTSAMSQAVMGIGSVDAELRDAIRSLSDARVPNFLGIGEYRGLLDSAGLVLPRWPRFRRLSLKERGERHKRRMARYRQPSHVAKAKSLVHQYESYLRDAIRDLMETNYGPGWSEERLPLCGEKGRDLLSRWRARDGDVLDHADYPHYAAIMAHEDHLEAVFAVGFADAETIHDLIGRARRLRAASHHPGHAFTPEDLLDLRLTWAAIAKGLRTIESAGEIVLDV